MTIKEIAESYKNYKECGKTLRNGCYDYIRDALVNNGKRIVFVDLENRGYSEDVVCVTYDGGRHPEYDVNPYSQVYSVFLDDETNKIFLETEDDDAYCLDFVWSNVEVYNVFLAVVNLIENKSKQIL